MSHPQIGVRLPVCRRRSARWLDAGKVTWTGTGSGLHQERANPSQGWLECSPQRDSSNSEPSENVMSGLKWSFNRKTFFAGNYYLAVPGFVVGGGCLVERYNRVCGDTKHFVPSEVNCEETTSRELDRTQRPASNGRLATSVCTQCDS